MDETESNEEFAIEKIVPFHEDPMIVRWVAIGLIEGRTESEMKSEVRNMRFDSHLDRNEWNSLMRRARSETEGMRAFVMQKAELDSVDYLRLDSYNRRKRMMARLEGLIEKSISESDSVSKMNSTSFMIGGLLKAQNDMDAFTGAKEAAPQVQVNIGYDPMEQFRTVIQAEVVKPVDADFTVADEDEE